MREALVRDDLLARAEAALAVALPDALGVEFLDPRAPLDGLAMTVTGLGVTPTATLHGAALGAAIEAAAFLAVLPTLSAGQHAVTHQISTQYLRPARAGQRVRIEGRLSRRAQTVAFVAVSARLDAPGEDRRAVAESQVVKSIVTY